VHQLFFARLVAENGKIKLVREAMNSAEIARAVFKQGYPNCQRGGSMSVISVIVEARARPLLGKARSLDFSAGEEAR